LTKPVPVTPDIVDEIVDGVSPALNRELHKIARQAQRPRVTKVARIQQQLQEAKKRLAVAEQRARQDISQQAAKPKPNTWHANAPKLQQKTVASLASLESPASQEMPWSKGATPDAFQGTRAMAALARKEGFHDWPDAFTLPTRDSFAAPPPHALRNELQWSLSTPSSRVVGGKAPLPEMPKMDAYSRKKLEAQVKERVQHLAPNVVSQLAEEELIHKAEASWTRAHQSH